MKVDLLLDTNRKFHSYSKAMFSVNKEYWNRSVFVVLFKYTTSCWYPTVSLSESSETKGMHCCSKVIVSLEMTGNCVAVSCIVTSRVPGFPKENILCWRKLRVNRRSMIYDCWVQETVCISVLLSDSVPKWKSDWTISISDTFTAKSLGIYIILSVLGGWGNRTCHLASHILQDICLWRKEKEKEEKDSALNRHSFVAKYYSRYFNFSYTTRSIKNP